MPVKSVFAQVPADSEYVELTRHVRGVPVFEVEGETLDGCPYSATISFSKGEGAYGLSELKITAGNAPITGTTLRDITPGDLIQRVLHDASSLQGDSMLKTSDGLAAGDARLRIQEAAAHKRPRPTPRVLDLVATVYELAKLAGAGPAKAVEHDFQVPPSTASHWIKLARERGHLD